MSAQHNKINVYQLTLMTMINMMGSGIIMLPTSLAQVGTISILSWLVTATGSMAMAYIFAKASAFSKKEAGMGGFAEYSFGHAGNFIANYSYSMSLVIANVAIAVSIVGYIVVFYDQLTAGDVTLSAGQSAMATIFILWLTMFANIRGPKFTGKLSNITVWGVIGPVLLLCVIGWFWFDLDRYISAWNPGHKSLFDGISSSISLTLWAFLGFETGAANMDAVEEPTKTIPIATFMGTLLAAIIYIISTNVIAGIVPNLDLAKSTAPFGLVFAQMFNPTVGLIVIGLMVVACLGSLLSWQFTVAQVASTSARIGHFPRIFSVLNQHYAPFGAMIIIVILQTCLAMMTISPDLTKQFEVIVELAVVTNIIPYILSLAAFDVMQRHANVPYRKRHTNNLIALFGSVYSLYALYSSGEIAMMFGGITVFAGYIIYGFSAHRFETFENIE